MLIHRLIRLATIAAVGTFAAACESSTEPDLGMEIDTQAALADYEALEAVLGSDELAGFQALGNRGPFGAAPAMGVVAGMRAPSHLDGGRAFALDLVRRIHESEAVSGPSAAPIISDTHRGVTFVYDPEIDDYAPDFEREGAPETGVRFITYELDLAGFPIVEEQSGHMDLIDEGDGSSEDIILHLIVVHDDVIALDYRTTLDDTDEGRALTVAGFLFGDNVRLDFDIRATGTEYEGETKLDISFDLGVEARDFSIVGRVRGIEDDDDGPGAVELTVSHRQTSIRIEVAGDAGIIEGTVFVNGDVFATVLGPEDEPTFLGAGGDPITVEEMLVLHRIFDSVEDVFDFLEDLLDPVDDLVFLGIVL